MAQPELNLAQYGRVFLFYFNMTISWLLPVFHFYSGPVRLSSKRDKPNICHPPNITRSSKNTCRSGSGDSSCTHMWARLKQEHCTLVLSACLSQSRPSVTTWEQHTHAHHSSLLSIHYQTEAFTEIS